MTDLATLVANRMSELEMSLRDVQRASGVSHTQVYRIINGRMRVEPTDDTLRGLARALRIPLGELRGAAGLPALEGRPFQLPERARRLTTRQREALLTVMDAMLKP